ncbi:MAG TPA: PAS domain S-box protein [Dehalococcoidia bacterium]
MATEDATVTEVGGGSGEDPDGALNCIRTAMHDSPATVVVLDSEGTIEYVNASFEEVSGYRAAEVVGEHIRILSGDEELNELVWKSLSVGDSWRGEMKIKRRSGETYDILASIQMVRYGDGGAAHFVSVGVDITEQKRVQEELAAREAYWRALVENTPDLIAEVDREGVITRLNRDPVGSTMDAVVGKTVYDFSIPESHAVWREALAKAFTDCEQVDFEVQAADGNGQIGWYATSIAPVCADGNVVAAVVSERNITAHKQAEAQLAERGAYWRALVESTPDHILVVNRDGVIESLNHAVPGTSVDEVVGRTVYDFLHRDYRDLWRGALAEVFAGGKPAEFEVKTVGDPRGEQWYANRLNAVRCGDAVVAAIGSSRNVTARKDAEERMRAIATAISDVIVVVHEGVLLEVLAPTKKDGLLPLFSEDLRGRRVEEFLPPEQAQQALEFTRETIATGEPREEEIVVDLPQGPTWLSARSAPVTLANGMVAAVVHILDITDRKRLEEELQRLREETEAQAEQGLERGSEYGLTFREVTVLSLIARGKSDKEIAALLALSPFTVNKHSSNLVRKLGSRSRSQAAARAVREGII